VIVKVMAGELLLGLKLAEMPIVAPLLKPLYRPAGELLKAVYGEAE